MRFRFPHLMFTTIALVGCSFGTASANTQADRDAIQAAGKQYIGAMQRGDNKVLRTMWTPEGDYVDSAGSVTKATDLFPESAEPTTPNDTPTVAPVWKGTLRFITPDVAIEDGMIESDAHSDGSKLSNRFSVIWVKRDGRWLIDGLREAASASPSINDRLSPLSWMIGEWAAKTDQAQILVSARWSDHGTYLLREFIVRGEGREPLSGTERIGWDPVAKKIKSWMFDSKGGAGEGYWRRDGDRWILDALHVMPDGEKAETTVIYTLTGPARFQWEVNRGKVADATLPSQKLEFIRAAD